MPPPAAPPLTRIAKRAYKRALARAAVPGQGGTFYRGRRQTLRQLQGQYCSLTPTPVRSRQRLTAESPAGPHVRYLTLNCGGLSSDVYQELLLTLDALPASTRPHIVAIQETHWSEDSATEYTTGSWQVISSHRHGYKAAAGVLVLVHRTLLKDAVLAYAEPYPGRVLHVRITHKSWALDCVVVYQRPLNWQKKQVGTSQDARDPGPTAAHTRRQVWDSIHGLLSALPQRHTLLLLGDFNTPLARHVRAGPQVAKWNHRLPADAERLPRLMDDHALTHLTSWSRRSGPTYVCGDQRSVIDHVFTRMTQAVPIARLAGRDPFRIAAWRSGGFHVALSGVLPLVQFLALTVQREVAALLPECHSIDSLNHCLIQVLRRCLPPAVKPSRLAPWQTRSMREGIRVMWQHYRDWRQATSRTGRAIWQAWLHFVKFRKAHGDFRKAGRQARSAWFQGRLDELQQHAHKKDARSLFQGVRALAPKTRHTAVQLRSAEGHILSPFQQAEILTTHYRKIYTRTLPDPDREMRMPPLQLDVPELRAALDALKAHKAVPAHLAPVAIWKLCSAELVPHLQRIANNFVAAPDLWHAAWWALLPKITKPTLPKHLRPIGLSEVSSRVIGKVLQCRLRPYVEAYLRDLPQWAYTPGRGTLDAALRVQAHCQQVMQKCQPNRWTVREARVGLPRPLHQVGGLQLSLDLSAAFDTLEWCHIADALRDADIPMELQAHIMEWHRNIKYHLEIQGQHIEIAASRGIKQGCLVAPLVWSLVTGGFLYLLALETDPLWVAQDVTAYADDFHAGSRVTNIRGLESLLFRLGSLLDILAQAGLNVNALKSAILYRFKGTFARTWLRQHIRPPLMVIFFACALPPVPSTSSQ